MFWRIILKLTMHTKNPRFDESQKKIFVVWQKIFNVRDGYSNSALFLPRRARRPVLHHARFDVRPPRAPSHIASSTPDCRTRAPRARRAARRRRRERFFDRE
jgi:hypothetical protein